ncbi:hypothetical protein NL501_27755, partial [Klebsiella pneumoniae]|nr:hypothetical protein [Klebsiella pneumoniae]
FGEQADRRAPVFLKAGFDFGGLFRDVHVTRAIALGSEARRFAQRFARHGAYAVRGNADSHAPIRSFIEFPEQRFDAKKISRQIRREETFLALVRF